MKQKIAELLAIKDPVVTELCGYNNVNYRVESGNKTFIFKTYLAEENLEDILAAENALLLFLSAHFKGRIPQAVTLSNQELMYRGEIEGQERLCRALSFVDGTFWGDNFPSPSSSSDAVVTAELVSALEDLGAFLAHLNLKLAGFKNYVIKARQSRWDNSRLLFNREFITDIAKLETRRLVSYFFNEFQERVIPHLHELPHGFVHGDANEWNILLQDDGHCGIIDFGDICYSACVNELAIAMVYVSYNAHKPLDLTLPLVAAYNKVRPLNDLEIQLLYYLVAARLCNSLCHSASARKLQPQNSYVSASEEQATAMLQRWLRLNPIAVEDCLRKACGRSALDKPSAKMALKRREKVISPILSLSYRKPIYFRSAALQYMYDNDGNTFLDAYNNIPHVGHCHPRVVSAGQRQMAMLNTNTRYLYDALPSYAEKLLAKFPPQLKRVFFVNSGSAASDLAIRLAKTYAAADHIMVMEHGYHGNTQSSMEISDYKFSHPKGSGQGNFVLKTALPDTYRGKYRQDDGSAGESYARDTIAQINQAHEKIAAFICEPIVGCGGQVPLAKGYLTKVYQTIRAQGGVCISDEVQTGFGRLGEVFWGYESQEVVPDIVVLGKPMANGHPMGAVVCSEKVAEAFATGVEFFSSFGGNPVSCAIGEEVLAVIDDEGLQENARICGNYYCMLLEQLKDKYGCIGDVRGRGLFLGVEIVKGCDQSPDTALAQQIKNHLREQHILISTDGPYDSVLKTKPPLLFNQGNVEQVVDCIDRYLAQVT